MVTRLIPYPILGLTLLLAWMALGEAYTPGRFILGVLIATAGTWTMAALQLGEPRLRRPGAALRLAGAVSIDIVRSNIAVARIVGRARRRATSGFLVIPLDLKSPHSLAVLACVLTATPGTIWVSYNSQAGTLLLHILDLVDEETWVKLIKERYERLLIEVFE